MRVFLVMFVVVLSCRIGQAQQVKVQDVIPSCEEMWQSPIQLGDGKEMSFSIDVSTDKYVFSTWRLGTEDYIEIRDLDSPCISKGDKVVLTFDGSIQVILTHGGVNSCSGKYLLQANKVDRKTLMSSKLISIMTVSNTTIKAEKVPEQIAYFITRLMECTYSH